MVNRVPRRAPNNALEPAQIPPRKPMRSARRISLFEREIQVRLSPAAIDVLMASASVLSEGEVMDGIYGGSTMLTIDLNRASVNLNEACDAATARTLDALLDSDALVQTRARAIAIREAEARAGGGLDDVYIDMRIERDGQHFHIDMNIEAIPRELP